MNPPLNGYLAIISSNNQLTVSEQKIYHGNNSNLSLTLTNQSKNPISIKKGTCIAHVIHNTIKEVEMQISQEPFVSKTIKEKQ